MKQRIIVDERIILREAIEEDAVEYTSIPFNAELLKMYGSEMNPDTQKSMERSLMLIKEIQDNPYEWAIEYEQRFIGQVRLTVDEHNHKAKFAVGIFNPAYWNKGIGTRVTEAVLQYGFKQLNLHRIYLVVLKYNERGIKSYLKAGFVIEGEEREAALINGKYETDVHMSILREEYMDRKSKY